MSGSPARRQTASLCHFSAISALLSRCWAGPGFPHWSSPMNSALIFLGVGGGGTVTELLREFPQQRPFLSGRGVGPDQVPRLRFSGVAVRYGIQVGEPTLWNRVAVVLPHRPLDELPGGLGRSPTYRRYAGPDPVQRGEVERAA